MQKQNAQNNRFSHNVTMDLLASTDVTPTAQSTPTPDSTITALQKEQLTQQVKQLENQNTWSWTNIATPITAFGTLGTIIVGVVGGSFTYLRWRKEQRNERNNQQKAQRIDREKRDEERFQIVVSGLGSKDIEAKVGAAIMLRTFLKSGYEQFYQQSFDLAVAHLRLRQVNSNELIDSLSQALIRVFTESFKLMREELDPIEPQEYNKHLDAAHIRLDGAYLARVYLQNVWMREASLIGANLHGTNLHESDLIRANLSGADLEGADLSKAKLRIANLGGAILTRVNLIEADLYGADLTDANFHKADLRGANLEETKPETARSLEGTKMYGVKGLTDPDQIEACKRKGAIFDNSDQRDVPNIKSSLDTSS